MSGLQIASVLLGISALIGYLNERFLKMPGTTGHFLLGILFSLAIIVCEFFALLPVHSELRDIIRSADFSEVLIGGMLSVLLFAGGLHTRLDILQEQKRTVFALAFFSTLLNTLVVGGGLYGLSQLLGFPFTLLQAMVFGALISPTDPLTALAVLTKLGIPKRLETILVGESLFNDGIGLVLFTVLSSAAFSGEQVSLQEGLLLFVRETAGGLVMGFLLAGVTHYLVKSSSDLITHTIITIAAVMGGYAASLVLHVSGPVAMVVFGLIAGNHTFETRMNRKERRDTHLFWTILDDVLSAVLFVMIGLQLVRIPYGLDFLLTGSLAIVLVLASRYVSLAGALNLLFIERCCSRSQFGIVNLLSWSGLRGGLSIAMAFNLPVDAPVKPLILDMTFAVVAFSILVQGLTIQRFFPKHKLEKLSRQMESQT